MLLTVQGAGEKNIRYKGLQTLMCNKN